MTNDREALDRAAREALDAPDFDLDREPAPTFVDSDEGDLDDPDEGGSDAPLLRVLGVIIALGVLIAILVLPPVSILDRGSGGVTTRERKQLPTLPPGLAARSSLFDLDLPPGVAGPVTITVRMNQTPVDAASLSVFTYEAGQWVRLGPATALDSGVAEATIDRVPGAVAVLERTAAARELGLLLSAGQVPDAAAGNAGIVAVPGARPALDAEGNPTVLEVNPVAVGPALASGRTVYLGTLIPTDESRSVLDALFGTPRYAELHAQRLVAAAVEVGADGVYVDYGPLDGALRATMTKFVEQLATAAKARDLGVIVAVPVTETANGGAYDWRALATAADGLWLKSPDNLDQYYQRMEDSLRAAREAQTPMDKLWLVVDRRSTERTPEGIRRITLREALTQASEFRPRIGVGIAPGDTVTLEGATLGGPNASGLRWDDTARAIRFQYEGRGGQRTVWIENRYSMSFRLDIARRFGLGGVSVAGAAADEGLPEVWGTVAQFVSEGGAPLEMPYGPYLQPNWRASDGAIEGTGGLVTWRAPQSPGVYDITLVVSDGVVFIGQQLSLRVAAPEAAAAPPAGAPSPRGN
jgi:hypothetical protein